MGFVFLALLGTLLGTFNLRTLGPWVATRPCRPGLRVGWAQLDVMLEDCTNTHTHIEVTRRYKSCTHMAKARNIISNTWMPFFTF